ncbi:PREDICTED: olfactory receptor 1J2-like, partial [Nanorana parkeri]|uniref:olfactory receptor 1J2-like n=1 Tax=Nanorana parkeri TaxID=125878 RepID=UPI000854EBF1
QKTRDNQTFITEIILLGFEGLHGIRTLVFFLLLLIYFVTICGNLLIIIVVSYSKNLQSPMYFFLTQLSISDIMLTTSIVPNLLHIILHEVGRMPLENCIIQFNVFVFSECSECLLLTVMSYDRYLAICKPLHYFSVMNHSLCMRLAGVSWLLSIFAMLMSTITLTSLDYCGPNIIDHFFCDVSPMLKLSCSDVFMVQAAMVFLGVPILFLPFIFIVISYIYVIFNILKIPSTTGKQKAFSTCSSHLTVVCIFYATLISNYGVPHIGRLVNVSKSLSLLYTLGTPLMNPIIYSLRNNEMKTAFVKLFNSEICYFLTSCLFDLNVPHNLHLVLFLQAVACLSVFKG